MHDENIVSYPDYFVNSHQFHPMQYIAKLLTQLKQEKRVIGVEMDQYYFSAKCYTTLLEHLPNATFRDCTSMVNWVRIIKSDQEIELMRRAGMLAEQAMQAGINAIHTGSRECDAAATIYYELVKGREEVWWGLSIDRTDAAHRR